MQNRILKLIQGGEGQYIEFKSALDRSRGVVKTRDAREIAKDIAEGLAEFANTDGGTLLLGVEDDGEITGIEFTGEQLARLENHIKTRWQSPVPYKREICEIEEKTIYTYEVDILPSVYSLSDGRTPFRFGTHTKWLSAGEIQGLKNSKTSALYERTPVPGVTLDDLEPALIEAFQKTMEASVGSTPEDILAEHDLILKNGQRTSLTLAACLAFGKPPMTRFHERCGVTIRRFSGETVRSGRENNETLDRIIEEPLPKLLQKAFETIQNQIKVSRKLESLFFEERPEYPTFAWQEAIVNAAVHRNYSYKGNDIEIRMFDDRMEIRSPGLPPAPVTIEQLKQRASVHSSRNPRLMRLMKSFRYVRERGEGLPRIFEEMEISCLQPPELRAEGEFFVVVLRNTPVFDNDTMEWLETFRGINLNARQRRILAHTYQNRGHFTLGDYVEINQLARDQAQREIRQMCEMNAVELIGTRRAAKYYPIIQNGNLIDRIRDFFTRHEFLTNSHFRRIIGPLSVQEASRYLQQLVDSGWIERRGERRGAKYFSTSKLLYYKKDITTNDK